MSLNSTGRYLAAFALFTGLIINDVVSSHLAMASQVATLTLVENINPDDPVGTYELGYGPAEITPFVQLNPTFSNPGYMFAGWNTQPDGTGQSYPDGGLYSFSADGMLFAMWTLEVVALNLSPNGGGGTIPQVQGSNSLTTTLPNHGPMFRPGFTFYCWNSQANGLGTDYFPGTSITTNTTLTLYAKWRAVAPTLFYGSIGNFARNTYGLTPKMKASIRSLATYLKLHHLMFVNLYGYTGSLASGQSNHVISLYRAQQVKSYLVQRLNSEKFAGVSITTSGEGTIGNIPGAQYARVEVFVY
jgi:OmpA family/Listeria-Bacteroides repeat domain (List_Bact_rpt)